MAADTTLIKMLDPQQSNLLFERLTITEQTLQEFCQNWDITWLAVFGSVLREDFSQASDIDFLLKFSPHHQLDFSTFLDLEEAFIQLVQRPVDLLFLSNLVRSKNWIRRRHILATAAVIYEK